MFAEPLDPSLRNRPSVLSVDSGYGSTTSPTSSTFDWAKRDAYERWKQADEASQMLAEEERAVEEAIGRLKHAKAAASQQTNSPRLRKKKSTLLLDIFRNKSKTNLSKAPSLPSTSELLAGTPDIPALERHLADLRTQKDTTERVANMLDECFDKLRSIVQGSTASPINRTSIDSTVTTYTTTTSDDPVLRAAEKSVVARDEAYNANVKTTAVMRYAQNAIQSTHHHYRQAMDISESVCSPKKSFIEAMMGDEQSREATYREAANWARKAQVCFNECVRALEPHAEILPESLVPCFDELKETGLLQSVKIYELMYGGRALAFGIKGEISVMLNKQEAIFARLTTFAVWIQNETVDCESVERQSLEARNAARRQLVQLWMRSRGWPRSSGAPSVS